MTNSPQPDLTMQSSNPNKQQPDAVGPSADASAPPPLPQQRHSSVNEPGRVNNKSGYKAGFSLRPGGPSSPSASGTQRHDNQPLEPSSLAFGDLSLPQYQQRQQQQEEEEQEQEQPIDGSSREADSHDTPQGRKTPQLAQKLPPMGIFKTPRKRRQSQLLPSNDTCGRSEDAGTAGHASKRQHRDEESLGEAPNTIELDDDNEGCQPFQGQQRQRYSPQTRWTAINTTRDDNGLQTTTSFSFLSLSRPGPENDQEQKTQQQREEEEDQFYHDHAYRTMDYAAPANKDNRRNKNQTAGGVWGAVVEPLVREDTEHNRAFAKRLEQRRRAREEPDASQRRGGRTKKSCSRKGSGKAEE
ncbi:hypothetical protein PG999_006906 [Apiospora kogelbergensis]|uniref:Uncharacterized protein n=1 Tax=Apiospora kogelbergensis TaxID=1337665 RepID=A0AAW0QWT2_9PEZI